MQISTFKKWDVALSFTADTVETDDKIYVSHSNHINTYVKPQNTIRSLLVAPKDKANKLDKCGVVYQVAWKDCTSTYVGESARPLKTRLNEHSRPSSPVGEHSANFRHDINWEGVRVLDREDNWFRRGVKESIHIRRTGSALNKDEGRHHLPRSYDRLLSRDSSPSGSGHVTPSNSQ